MAGGDVRIEDRLILGIIGYGCLLSLSALSFWSPLSLVPSAVSGEEPSFYVLVQFGLALSFAIALVGYLIDSERLPRAVFAATLTLLVVGFALSANSLGGAFDLPPAVLSSGALCTGLGLGFGLICWMLAFTRFCVRRAWCIMVAGSVFAAVPTLAISYLQTINPMSFSSLVLILLLLSLVFLALASQGDDPADRGSDVADVLDISSLRPIGKAFGIALPCIAVLALFQPLLDTSGINYGLTSFEKTTLSQIGNIAGALVVLLVGRLTDWRINIPALFVFATPVFATVCLLFPFVSERYWFIFSFVGILFFSTLSLGAMLSCLRSFHDGSIPVALSYGMVGLCLYAPGLIGSALGWTVDHLFGTSRLVLGIALSALVAGCIVLVLLIWRRSQTGLLDLGWPGASRPFVAVSSLESGRAERARRDGLPGEDPTPMAAACAILSDRHGLTVREREILEMLAHGRNVPFIAQTLELSSHTVRGYVKSIYARLDVHSRQEVIDLVEKWLPS